MGVSPFRYCLAFVCTVKLKPEVMVQTSVAAVAESAATLLCNATGKPLPDLEWWHDGQKLKAMKSTTRLELLLPNVRQDQAGQYECRSSNMAGNASKSTELIVHCKDTTNLCYRYLQ